MGVSVREFENLAAALRAVVESGPAPKAERRRPGTARRARISTNAGYEPDGCFCCALGERAPCPWCESLRECGACGEFIPEDDMDGHVHEQHPGVGAAA